MFSVAFHFFYGPLVSVRFNGHFPGGFVLAGTRISPFCILLELRMKEVEPEDVQKKKLQSNRRHQQTNTQHFHTPDGLPVAQSTASHRTEGDV